MDFDFSEWTTRSLLKFSVHVNAAWVLLGKDDVVASDYFVNLINGIADELRRRNEWNDRMEELIIRSIDKPLSETLDRIVDT